MPGLKRPPRQRGDHREGGACGGRCGGIAIRRRAPFRFIPHTADVAAEVWSDTLPGLYENAGLAFSTVLVDARTVLPSLSVDVEVRSVDRESLMVDWLNELLYIFETEMMLFSEFAVSELREDVLRAVARGERLDPLRHRIKVGVKAVTYHGLEVRQAGGGWTATVVFDV